MDSLPKVISVIETEIEELEVAIGKHHGVAAAILASEQAGLAKILAFAQEVSGIQSRFERSQKEK